MGKNTHAYKFYKIYTQLKQKKILIQSAKRTNNEQ